LEKEYPDLEIDEDNDRHAFLTSTAHMVLKGMHGHVSATRNRRQRLPFEARMNQAQSGMLYAELIQSSIPVLAWTESWERSRAISEPEMPEAHIVSALCASALVERYGDAANVLSLALDMQSRSLDLLEDV
jgi:hypothetical protein